MKIGILGGTFDPIHEGHLAIARAAKNQFHLDKVFFVPAFLPPHKTARRDLTPAPYRYRMVEMAIRNEPSFEISDAELNRPDISYTVDTLKAFKEKYPAAELYFIVGSDTMPEIPKWYQPDEINRLVKFLMAPREGVDQNAALPYPKNTQWIKMTEVPASSSRIREMLKQGRPVGPVLPEGVESYLKRMNLYGEGKTCSS